MGYNTFGGNVIISGAFGLFHRDTVIEAGGYQPTTVGEDMELVLRIHHKMRAQGRRYRVVQITEPICYTEAPENWTLLSRQRDRWQRGLLEAIWLHKGMLLRPKYGVIGLLIMPIFLFFEAIGPLIELGGYLWFGANLVLGTADPKFAVMFTLSALFWGFLLSVQSLVLDDLNTNIYRGFRVRMGLVAAALLENVGYRQMTLFFRLKGTVKYLAGEKAWGKMKRKGFQDGAR
jgi:cellulose synthase/poly-beta-1,6-N-acetylglucosamine synthase-like glycosyltransferase